MNNKTKAHISLIAANLIYGANFTIAKEIMPSYIKPFGFIVLRVISVLLLFFAVQFFYQKEKVERKDMFKLLLCGLFGVAVNQLMFFKGLSITTPINAALMITTIPIMVLIMASILIREKITGSKIVGIILGATGASIIILFGKKMSFGLDTLWGDVFVFINSVSYGIYMIIVKPLMHKYSSVTVMKWIFFYGFIFVLPFGYQEFSEIQWLTFSPKAWLSTLYVVVFATLLAYLLYNFAVKTLTPSIASMYVYLQPVFATTIAIIFRGDHLTLLHIISTILIFTGVYLVSRNNKIVGGEELL